MASGSGAFGVKGGYNQSGGGYYISVDDNLWLKLKTYSGSSGSGGAATVGNFLTGPNIPTGVPGNISSLFATGALVKDMGRTVVSAGRTFRKIQGIAPTANNSSPTFGVSGTPFGTLNSVDPGYLTYYVEVGREGAGADAGTGADTLARLARYF